MVPLPDPLPSDRLPPGRWQRCLEAGVRQLLAVVLLVPCLLFLGAAPGQASLLHLEGPIPPDLGVQVSGLAPCRNPSHCAFASWPVDDAPAALETLLPAVLALDGVTLVETNPPYLHATVTSRLFGFVDDLELFADAAQRRIQARSQSRLGDSDLGVNGRRLDHLHQALLEAMAP